MYLLTRSPFFVFSSDICFFEKKRKDFLEKFGFGPTAPFFSQYSSIVGFLYNLVFQNYRVLIFLNDMETKIVFKAPN